MQSHKNAFLDFAQRLYEKEIDNVDQVGTKLSRLAKETLLPMIRQHTSAGRCYGTTNTQPCQLTIISDEPIHQGWHVLPFEAELSSLCKIKDLLGRTINRLSNIATTFEQGTLSQTYDINDLIKVDRNGRSPSKRARLKGAKAKVVKKLYLLKCLLTHFPFRFPFTLLHPSLKKMKEFLQKVMMLVNDIGT